MKDLLKENKNKYQDVREDIKKQIANKELEKEEINENIKKLMKDYQEEAGVNDPGVIFKDNEIIVGNYRLKRKSSSAAWMISEVAQMSSVNAWHPIFRYRWKGRLSIATRGDIDFHTLLRIDYLTDYIALMAILTYEIISFM